MSHAAIAHVRRTAAALLFTIFVQPFFLLFATASVAQQVRPFERFVADPMRRSFLVGRRPMVRRRRRRRLRFIRRARLGGGAVAARMMARSFVGRVLLSVRRRMVRITVIMTVGYLFDAEQVQVNDVRNAFLLRVHDQFLIQVDTLNDNGNRLVIFHRVVFLVVGRRERMRYTFTVRLEATINSGDNPLLDVVTVGVVAAGVSEFVFGCVNDDRLVGLWLCVRFVDVADDGGFLRFFGHFVRF